MAEPIDTFVMGDHEAMTSTAEWIISVGHALGRMGDHGQLAVAHGIFTTAAQSFNAGIQALGSGLASIGWRADV